MRFFFKWSIRTQLSFLVVISLLPAMGIIIYSGVERRHLAEQEVKESTHRLMDTISDRQQIIEESTRQLLMTLSKLPEKEKMNIKNINKLLRELLPLNPIYANIFMTDKNGLVIASALPTMAHNLSKRKYFIDAMTKRSFSAGEYIIGATTKKPVFHFAYPMIDNRGAFKGVVAVAVDLSSYGKIVALANLPSGSVLSLTDRKGVRLYRYPENDKYAGQADLQSMITNMSNNSDEKTFLARGEDGLSRYYAFKRFHLKSNEPLYMYMRIGIPEESALSLPNSVTKRNILLLGIVSMLSFITAWFLGSYLIVKPLNRIMYVTNRFRQGEMDIKTDLPHTNNEVGKLAEAYDAMSDEIVDRQKALVESEQRYRIVANYTHDWEFWMDADKRYSYISPSCEEITGYSAAEFINAPALIEEIAHPEDRELFENHISKDFDQDKNCNFDFRLIRRDGEIRWINHVCRPVYDEKGTFIGRRASNRDITYRKLTEEKLLENESTMESIFFASPVGIGLMSERRTKRVNDRLCKMLGYTAEELIGMGSRIFYSSTDEYIRVREEMVKQISRSGFGSIETTWECKDGRMMDILLRCTSIPLANTKSGLTFTALDISAYKKMYQDLISASNQLSNIIDFLPDATMVVDNDKKVIGWNRAMEEMTGIKKEGMIGQGDYAYAQPFYGRRGKLLLDFIDDIKSKEFSTRYKSFRKVGNTLYVEAFADALFDGRGAYLFVAASPLFDTVGTHTGAIQSIRDITEQKKMEEKYRNIFENAIDGISQSTIEGRYLAVNMAFARMFGYDSPHEMITEVQDISKQTYVYPEKRHEYIKIIREKGFVQNFEMERYRKDGKKIWVSYTGRAEKTSSGEIEYIENITKDITEAKSLELQLFEAQKMKAIGTLAGGIAHDFNNILGSIMGYSDLAMYEEDDIMRRSHIDQIMIASERAKNLVKQILTFSRNGTHDKKPMDIRIVTKEALNLLGSTTPTTIQIHRNITNDNCIVNADLTQIHQVIMNLCNNATHAIGEKGGIIEVSLVHAEIDSNEFPRIQNLPPGSYIKLTISDTGHGMDSEILGHIFDPFFTTKNPGEGTGLGLSVVYGIVKNHGGAIMVSSELGKGAIFDVYLPRERNASPAPERSSIEPISQGKERILFIDDEKSLVDLCERMLFSLGYIVTGVTKSDEAFEVFSSNPANFDLVITDMTMPHMLGTDLAKKILAIRPDMPIILCTGNSEFITPEKALAIGIKAFVMKPLTRKELAKAVRNVLDSPAKQEKRKPINQNKEEEINIIGQLIIP